MTELEARLPVTLLTGFLGAGKTTLVNRVLTERHGERIAVLVNEFGDVGIDGRLVVRSDEEIVELVNGCVCCSVRGDLVRAIGGMLRRRKRAIRARPFERLLIETSGLASPGPVVQTLLVEPELARETVPVGVITLAHAALVAEQLERHPEAVEQVGYADAIVLNHTDRADESTIAAAEEALRARNAMAPILRAERAAIDVSTLLDLPPANPRDASHAPATEPHTHDAGTIVLRTGGALDLARLKMWLQFLASHRSQEIWRLKGILRCGGNERAVVVQGVYQFLELGPGDDPAPEESVLVLIGRGFDRAEIERGWRACRPPGREDS